MGELKKISDYSDSAMHWSPREALEDALADLDNPETEFDGVLILKVQRDKSEFNVSRLTSKLRTTEVIAAIETLKYRYLSGQE